jgi:hypothetical protein
LKELVNFDNKDKGNAFWPSFGNQFRLKLVLLFMIVLLLLSIEPIFIDLDTFSVHMANAQQSSNSTFGNNFIYNTQQWTDKQNNIKIQFGNTPKTPIVDAKTQLKFLVQNMTNSKNVNDLHARVVITTNSSGQMRIFKFENISSSNGNFNVNYFFPDSGVYQVMTRIDMNNGLSTLGSFKVDVPFQPFGTFTAPTYSFMLIIIAGIIIAIAAVSLLLVLQRRQRTLR